MGVVVVGLRELLVATVGLAALGALGGFLAAHFGGWTGAAQGVGWGMTVGGGMVGLVAGGSGSPSENLLGGKAGVFGTFWSESAPLPQSPLSFALAGLFVFAGGLAVLVLA